MRTRTHVLRALAAALVALALAAPADADQAPRPTNVAAAVPAAAPTKARAAVPLKVVTVGDSYTYCVGATNVNDCWEFAMASALGWNLIQAIGDPSGGFVASGQFGTFYQMINENRATSAGNGGQIRTDADVVIIQGGFNDKQSDPTAVAFATLDMVKLVQRRVPNARVIVLGAFLPQPQFAVSYPGFFPTRQGSWSAVQANPITGAAGGRDQRAGWIDGTTISYAVGQDGSHPTNAGHRSIGNQVATILAGPQILP